VIFFLNCAKSSEKASQLITLSMNKLNKVKRKKNDLKSKRKLIMRSNSFIFALN
jgi:hypothetical protein